MLTASAAPYKVRLRFSATSPFRSLRLSQVLLLSNNLRAVL